ncbi:hypothetical protein UlMin_032127, partial [Ulmus minor]
MLFLEGAYFSNVNCSKRVVLLSSEVLVMIGNHAATLSLAVKQRGIPVYIVVPQNAPKCKLKNVMRYGGQIIWSEPNMPSKESVAAKVMQETCTVLLHPHND